jgi:hypothetical protein
MALPGPRFVCSPYEGQIIDTYKLPRGWFASTKQEREAAVVVKLPKAFGASRLDLWSYIRRVCDDLNAGTRTP